MTNEIQTEEATIKMLKQGLADINEVDALCNGIYNALGEHGFKKVNVKQHRNLGKNEEFSQWSIACDPCLDSVVPNLGGTPYVRYDKNRYVGSQRDVVFVPANPVVLSSGGNGHPVIYDLRGYFDVLRRIIPYMDAQGFKHTPIILPRELLEKFPEQKLEGGLQVAYDWNEGVSDGYQRRPTAFEWFYFQRDWPCAFKVTKDENQTKMLTKRRTQKRGYSKGELELLCHLERIHIPFSELAWKNNIPVESVNWTNEYQEWSKFWNIDII